MGFTLDDRRTLFDLSSRKYVCDFQANQITSSKFAVDGKAEKRQVAMIVRDLQAHADRPDVFCISGRFCPTMRPLFQAGRQARVAGKFGICMMGSPIHHAHPHRKPDVDTTVYHGPGSRRESPVRTDNTGCCTRHISARRAGSMRNWAASVLRSSSR
jgi:hypothetical protein